MRVTLQLTRHGGNHLPKKLNNLLTPKTQSHQHQQKSLVNDVFICWPFVAHPATIIFLLVVVTVLRITERMGKYKDLSRLKRNQEVMKKANQNKNQKNHKKFGFSFRFRTGESFGR